MNGKRRRRKKKINEGNGISTIPFYNQPSGKTKKKMRGGGGGADRQTETDRRTVTEID